MKIDSLEKLYVHELKDLHSAEGQLLKALPEMIDAASNADLRSAFESHLEETKTHCKRLERIFEGLDYEPGGHKCAAMEGLIQEASSLLNEGIPSDVLDAALIAAAQRIEHYEMAGYGVAYAFADKLGRQDDVKHLQATLDEEGAADRELSRIATRSVNFVALTA